MKSIFKIVVINFAIFCTMIVSIEMLGQAVYFFKSGSFLMETGSVQSRTFEIHPFLAGRPKSSIKVEKEDKTIRTTSYHTRWTGAEKNDSNLTRIAVLGGSTTFGTGVTDEDSWPALLQAKLGKQYSVINYGVPGYSTAENIIQMALIVPEKRPHIVIFYEGWNDIKNYHEKNISSDYYQHGVRQYTNLGVGPYGQQNKFEEMKDVFATVRLMNKVKNLIVKPPKRELEVFDTPDEFVDRIYSRNLYTLKLLSENIGASTVFVPQLLNYTSYAGNEGSREWTRHIKDNSMPALMDRFNSRMNGLCAQGEKRCTVLSEMLNKKWVADDFVDDGHFSKSGGLKFVEVLLQFIDRTGTSSN